MSGISDRAKKAANDISAITVTEDIDFREDDAAAIIQSAINAARGEVLGKVKTLMDFAIFSHSDKCQAAEKVFARCACGLDAAKREIERGEG